MSEESEIDAIIKDLAKERKGMEEYTAWIVEDGVMIKFEDSRLCWEMVGKLAHEEVKKHEREERKKDLLIRMRGCGLRSTLAHAAYFNEFVLNIKK